MVHWANRHKMKKFIYTKQDGFSLVELLVATSIFLMIVITTIGALVSVSNSSKQMRATRSAMDNVNYAMDNISRSLRVGSGYYCASSVSLPLALNAYSDCTGEREIGFVPAKQTVGNTSFKFNNGAIEKCEANKTPSCLPITSPEVKITDLLFTVIGSDPSSSPQPSVTILIKGEVTARGKTTEFALQNYVSQRNAE